MPGATLVEKADQCRVDMPDLINLTRATELLADIPIDKMSWKEYPVG